MWINWSAVIFKVPHRRLIRRRVPFGKWKKNPGKLCEKRAQPFWICYFHFSHTIYKPAIGKVIHNKKKRILFVHICVRFCLPLDGVRCESEENNNNGKSGLPDNQNKARLSGLRRRAIKCIASSHRAITHVSVVVMFSFLRIPFSAPRFIYLQNKLFAQFQSYESFADSFAFRDFI